MAGFAERFASAAVQRAEFSVDPFRPAMVTAALAVTLLRFAENEAVSRAALTLLNTTRSSLLVAAKQLSEDLDETPYALLARRGGGLSDLFFVPLKVSQALGWVGASVLLSSEADRAEAESVFGKLLRQFIEHYSGSMVALSDAQAPHWAAALSIASGLRLAAEAEQLAGHLFNSYLHWGGAIARSDLPAESVLDFLRARKDRRVDRTELLERPNQTLAVLLRSATLLGLEEIFDEDLSEIDGDSFLAYVTSDFAQFGAPLMSGGRNYVWTVGHDVFRISDFARTWPAPLPTPASPLIRNLAVLSSLLYPDRVAWFLLEGPVATAANEPEMGEPA